MEQTDLLRFTIDVLERLNIRYMVVGSMASSAYGEPRLTHDIDIVLELSSDRVAELCEAFPAPEFYLSEPAARVAVRNRHQFNIVHPASGNKIDFMFPRDNAWGRSQLDRRQRVLVLTDREGYTAAPEDVILGKLWYYAEGGSEKHLRDIAGILRVKGTEVNRAEISRWASMIGLADIWTVVERRVDGAPD